MPEIRLVQSGLITWALGSLVTIVLFLLGFGIKDARASLGKVNDAMADLRALREIMIQLEKRLERLEREDRR